MFVAVYITMQYYQRLYRLRLRYSSSTLSSSIVAFDPFDVDAVAALIPATVPPTAAVVPATVDVAKPAAPIDCSEANSDPPATLPIDDWIPAAIDPPTTPADENPMAPSATGANAKQPSAPPTANPPNVAARASRDSGFNLFHSDPGLFNDFQLV